jgi:hypothetical protein
LIKEAITMATETNTFNVAVQEMPEAATHYPRGYCCMIELPPGMDHARCDPEDWNEAALKFWLDLALLQCSSGIKQRFEVIPGGSVKEVVDWAFAISDFAGSTVKVDLDEERNILTLQWFGHMEWARLEVSYFKAARRMNVYLSWDTGGEQSPTMSVAGLDALQWAADTKDMFSEGDV